MILLARWMILALEGPGGDAQRAASQALGKVANRWFDPATQRVRPVDIPVDARPSGDPSWLRTLGNLFGRGLGVGNILPVAGLVIALLVLVGILVWFWREYQPIPGEADPRPAKPGGARSIEALPEALRGDGDPWAEALRLRDLGDRGASVVRLFAHQLLTLSRLDLVRLAPGRTGRQLVRSVSDPEFRNLATATLRSFEAVFYGHRDLSDREFAAVWAGAEQFERRAAQHAGAGS